MHLYVPMYIIIKLSRSNNIYITFFVNFNIQVKLNQCNSPRKKTQGNMHDVYHVDHVYMIPGGNIHFYVKHIAQVKF
jgi:hypothetical protein